MPLKYHCLLGFCLIWIKGATTNGLKTKAQTLKSKFFSLAFKTQVYCYTPQLYSLLYSLALTHTSMCFLAPRKEEKHQTEFLDDNLVQAHGDLTRPDSLWASVSSL